MKKFWLLLLLLICWQSWAAHPLKMAYTAVRYNAHKQVFEISPRVFQDDFEATLQSNYHYSGGDVFTNQKSAVTQQVVNTFFQKNFTFSVNGKPLKMHYQKTEQKQQMGIIVWYETEKVAAAGIKQIAVHNIIMMESFAEQVNMFNLKIGDDISRTLRFDTGQTRETISF